MLDRQLTDSVVRLSGWLLYRICARWQVFSQLFLRFLIAFK